MVEIHDDYYESYEDYIKYLEFRYGDYWNQLYPEATQQEATQQEATLEELKKKYSCF